MPILSCNDLRASVATLRNLAERFNVAMGASAKTGDYTEPKRLKSEIEIATTAIEEQLIMHEVRELKLELQYAEQYRVLESAGILETISNGEKGIHGIDGKEYPVPSFETVMARAIEKKGVIKEKGPQGFTKMLLVPFGMSLDELAEKCSELLKSQHDKGKLKTLDGTPCRLDVNLPFYVFDNLENGDVSNKLVYDPKSLTPENHGGKSKAEIIAEQAASGDTITGWRIILMEDLPILPKVDEGKTVGNRKQLEAQWHTTTMEEYRATLDHGAYKGEHGLNPEEWLTLAISNLVIKGEVTDDYDIGPATLLYGSYLPGTGVPEAVWDSDDQRLMLGADFEEVGWDLNSCGRTSVRI